MRDFALGARAADEHLGRRLPLTLAALGLALTLATAWLEGRAHPVYGSYGALLGATFGIAVPVYSYCLATRLSNPRAATSTERWARLGANRRWLRAAEFVVALGYCGLFSLLAGGGAVLLAGAPPESGLLRDVMTTAGVSQLGALGYLSFFFVAASLWRRAGAAVALVADWMFGSGTDFGGLLFPRGHLRSLMGGEPVFGLSQTDSSLALLLLAVALLLVCTVRTPP